jgi:O-methyltransferase
MMRRGNTAVFERMRIFRGRRTIAALRNQEPFGENVMISRVRRLFSRSVGLVKRLIRGKPTNVAEVVKSYMANKKIVAIPLIASLGRPRHLDVMQVAYTNEYVRLSQLDLAIDEIKRCNTAGDIAELGVYQGHFAAVLNRTLPDRDLYLFDTFEGFEPEQEQFDKQMHGLVYKRDFSDTSVDLVMNRMPHPDKCVVRKGLFPRTATGLEDCRFCFVSIDADLYEPIRAGLDFFFDRTSPGGFIFVHDYNNAMFPGARRAVLDFAETRGAAFVPATDTYGTAIFRR